MKQSLFLVVTFFFIFMGSAIASTIGDIYLKGVIKSFDKLTVTIETQEKQLFRLNRRDVPSKSKLQVGKEIIIPIQNKKSTE